MDFTNISKICCDCKQEKPASEYYKQRDSRRPGLVHLRCRCIPCTQSKKNAKRSKTGKTARQLVVDRIPSKPTQKLIERNAREAWQYWIDVLAPDAWLDQYRATKKKLSNEASRLRFAAEYAANPGLQIYRARLRKAHIARATPAWADKEAIKDIYKRAGAMRAAGIDVHVDHVIPLKGRRVCGLHVHNNLRIIPANDNRAKRNHFEIA